MGSNTANGHAPLDRPKLRAFPPGVHVPSLTWFKNDKAQGIDWAVQEAHLRFLISSGLHGIVLAGTNGEAACLTSDEKRGLVSLTRRLAVELGRPDLPITAGCTGQCTQDVVRETVVAAEAGADFALVLVPSYFHWAMDDAAVVAFFCELASSSPLPIIIYNFPSVAGGIDLNADVLSTLARDPSDNIAGVKLTCGGIAKVSRLASRFPPARFAVLAGQSDWLVPALAVGAAGVITGVANLCPRVCTRVYDLGVAALGGGEKAPAQVEEARAAQWQLAQAEWGFAKGGVNGTKWIAARLLGYPDGAEHCRRPQPQFADAEKRDWITDVVEPLWLLEGRERERAAKGVKGGH